MIVLHSLKKKREEMDQWFGRNENPLSDIMRLNREHFMPEMPKVRKNKALMDKHRCL